MHPLGIKEERGNRTGRDGRDSVQAFISSDFGERRALLYHEVHAGTLELAALAERAIQEERICISQFASWCDQDFAHTQRMKISLILITESIR